jgi:hypothetical protein
MSQLPAEKLLKLRHALLINDGKNVLSVKNTQTCRATTTTVASPSRLVRKMNIQSMRADKGPQMGLQLRRDI